MLVKLRETHKLEIKELKNLLIEKIINFEESKIKAEETFK